MKERVESPIYAKIALDMAGRIYRGEFREGDRIKGRSTLAGEYNVSPETIRRSMNLLEDMKVVGVEHGKGIFVLSKNNAYVFMERFQNKENLESLKDEILGMIDQIRQTENKMLETLDRLIDYSGRLKNTHTFNPIEYEVPSGSILIGKTTSEMKFWQNTGATIIGIKRSGNVILSPGPYAAFLKGDIILVIGEMAVMDRMKELYG